MNIRRDAKNSFLRTVNSTEKGNRLMSAVNNQSQLSNDLLFAPDVTPSETKGKKHNFIQHIHSDEKHEK